MKERRITNRWSSRLGGRLELRLPGGKEPRSLGVVGGAAQLYVRQIKVLHIYVLRMLDHSIADIVWWRPSPWDRPAKRMN